MLKIGVEPLMAYCTDIFKLAGLNDEDSRIASQSLVEADMRGISSHGVTRIRTYAKRLSTGVIDPGSDISLIKENPSTIMINGGNGMGSIIGDKTMRLCMQKAEQSGSCFAAVNNGNHFGIGSFFTQPAAKQGYIAIAMSNAPASVVPYGGAEKKIGTNPLSIAIPTGDDNPYVLDMATSVVAQGKIIQAKKDGKSVPSGWAVDSEGRDTMDPDAALAGAMLPFGGPKGYAIGLMVQILCSALTGANQDSNIPSFWNNFEDPQNLGHFFGVLKIDSFIPFDNFRQNISEIKNDIKCTKPGVGFSEVLIPGEIESDRQKSAETIGVELTDAIIDDIKLLGSEYGVDTSIFTE